MGAATLIPVVRNLKAEGAWLRWGYAGSARFGEDWDPQILLDLISSWVKPTSGNLAILPDCAAGNCTFDNWGPPERGIYDNNLEEETDSVVLDITHASVGICSKCLNVTPLLEIQERSCSLPDGLERSRLSVSPTCNLTLATRLASPDFLDRPPVARTFW
ncbi:hypothetical protein F4818DRAFT_85905 [Hypoxylon cercidicola]|nr:hypothetical protein F4818DRAFT_85905 [Hypoxylon cercidicola]